MNPRGVVTARPPRCVVHLVAAKVPPTVAHRARTPVVFMNLHYSTVLVGAAKVSKDTS